jgi:hypothetical protein
MKQLNLFFAILALTLIAFFPAAVRADDALDGLDVTMIVLDGKADLDMEMSTMSGPEGDDDIDEDDWNDEDEDDSAEDEV